MTREDAISILETMQTEQEEKDFLSRCALDMAIEALKEQRPRGEWIKFECGYETHSKCSECHNTNTWGEVTYCPWCGSKNEKGGDGE